MNVNCHIKSSFHDLRHDLHLLKSIVILNTNRTSKSVYPHCENPTFAPIITYGTENIKWLLPYQSFTYICKLNSLDLKQKKIPKKSRKFSDFFFFYFFISKSRNREEFTKFNLENESRNSGDHEFWNHEMRGSPVLLITNYSTFMNEFKKL
jgi:hypothetical protein